MLYLLNSPILSGYGVYDFKPISPDKAKRIIAESDQVQSAIGHESTARVLSSILSYSVEANRVRISMNVNDSAIVFRLLERLPEGKILSEEELKKVKYELGILTRIE